MNNSYVWGLFAIIVIVGGAVWYMGKDTAMVEGDYTMGSYAYVCTNNAEFTMEPSSDVSTIRLTSGTGMTFGTVTLTSVPSTAGVRFEGGAGMVFVGAGEDVTLTVNGTPITCAPKSTGEAPWNWGDAAEGGGSVQPDARLVVGESIMGKWQSKEDAKSVREFKGFTEGSMSGQVVEWYDNESVSTGTYVAFTKENPVTVSFPIEANTVYLQLTMSGTQADKLNFKVVKMTPEELELIYMDRGGALTYTRIQ